MRKANQWAALVLACILWWGFCLILIVFSLLKPSKEMQRTMNNRRNRMLVYIVFTILLSSYGAMILGSWQMGIQPTVEIFLLLVLFGIAFFVAAVPFYMITEAIKRRFQRQ